MDGELTFKEAVEDRLESLERLVANLESRVYELEDSITKLT